MDVFICQWYWISLGRKWQSEEIRQLYKDNQRCQTCVSNSHIVHGRLSHDKFQRSSSKDRILSFQRLLVCVRVIDKFVESGNKSLEYCKFVPKAKGGIHRSTDKIISHTDITHRKRQMEAHASMNQKIPVGYRQPASNKMQRQEDPCHEDSDPYDACISDLSVNILWKSELGNRWT